MRRLRILTLCTLLAAAAIFFFKERPVTTIPAGEGLVIKKEWLLTDTTPVTPAQYVRPADQTFLTYPEWYLVFSPDEQAQTFKRQTSTTFPFMSHTAQIWESYKIVNDQIKDNFPYNEGYHFMIKVIGSSATAEYAVKSFYETIFGRLTDTYEVVTEEDEFNAQFTQDYVDFIKDRPWYEFDFRSQLGSLWTNTSFFGENFFRKWDRKYILTSELLVKILYGKLIGFGTATIYEEALFTTEVLVDSLPQNNLSLKIIKRYPDGSALLSLPRYDKFNAAACELAAAGFSFREIAGNTSAILLTVLLPSSLHLNPENTQTVFTQPIPADTRMKRMALAVPVKDLNKLLLHLEKEKIIIEHIFDF
jgi:hypothetical protein